MMGDIMKRILKRTALLFIGLILLLIVLMTVSYLNHINQLSNEDERFIPNGQMVEVDGHSLHVYTEGEGDIPLVFMAGGGTSSPVLDFKTLSSELSDDHQIVVVEKMGYGFSEIADVDRDIDTILYETRTALSKAGIAGPYILVPHSMSGIEAIYWAQLYPDEIIGIVGLDMATPAVYEDYPINTQLTQLTAMASRFGITRWIQDIAVSDAVISGNLTEEEKELQNLIFHRRTMTQPMLNEVLEIKSNAERVGKGGIPAIPMLLFSSNGEGTGMSNEAWIQHQTIFAESADTEVIALDASHYIHNIEYEKIADEMATFVQKIEIDQ